MHGVWAAKGERPERPSAAPSYPWQCCWEAPELTRTLTRTRSLTVTPWQCCWEPEMWARECLRKFVVAPGVRRYRTVVVGIEP